MATELAVERASSNQAGKEKNLFESSFAEQLSKATEEIRGLKELLNQKEVYAGELVQTLTQAQEDLRVSSNRVQFLESSLAPLQASYDVALAEKEELGNKIEHWERDYEALEDKAAVEVSWAFLNTRHGTLMEASREGFDLATEIAKIKETIEKTQQSQSFSSPVADISEGDEVTPGEAVVQSPSAQVVPPASDDTMLHPTGSNSAPQ
ncbi:PREDICTED: tropomyosin-like [Nicotiana attenuata]|uniref:tropomyosin-like n=1 Tax=Nicotiana attenuata TaxID=49451 RepID=UPI0009047E63|nr:PREDICTED: tropomyosin-like [Nicotiana attenuata]